MIRKYSIVLMVLIMGATHAAKGNSSLPLWAGAIASYKISETLLKKIEHKQHQLAFLAWRNPRLNNSASHSVKSALLNAASVPLHLTAVLPLAGTILVTQTDLVVGVGTLLGVYG